MKNVIIKATMMMATAIPIPRPALAPGDEVRRRRCVRSGEAVAVPIRKCRRGKHAMLNLKDVDIVILRE